MGNDIVFGFKNF